MAGRQGHIVYLGHVPGIHQYAARIGVIAYQVHGLGNLVNMSSLVIVPGPPLVAIYRSELAALVVTPAIPDVHTLLLEVFLVCVACQEPQQFLYYAAGEDLLGGEQGEALGQVETHLVSEDALGAHSGAVRLHSAVLVYFP